MKKAGLMILIWAVFFSSLMMPAAEVWADETGAVPVYVTVTAAEIAQNGTWKSIQSALNTAKDYATEMTPYIIKINPGIYTLDAGHLFRLYSNTTIDLSDVTIQRAEAGNVFRLGATDASDSRDGVTGYYYQNIKIIGGVIDGKNFGTSMVKIGHAKNFTMENVTVKDITGGHLFEAAGVDGLNILNCTFSGQKLDSDGVGKEAIQLDVLNFDRFSKYRAEDLPNKNVRIEGTTFANAPRGIGSHSSILNLPVDGITIKNCTFSDIAETAICGQGWSNCTVTGNTIESGTRGIVMYAIYAGGSGTFLPSELASESGLTSSADDKISSSSNIKGCLIKNNTIKIKNKIDSSINCVRTAIDVCGGNVTLTAKSADGSCGLPKGNVRMEDVEVSGNVITVPSSNGIRVIDTKTATVASNTVNSGKVSGSSAGYYGIEVSEGSEAVKVNKNSVTSTTSNGIYVVYSDVSGVTENTVKTPGANGIYLYSSTAEKVTNNTVNNAKDYGIYFNGQCTIDKFANNTMRGCDGGGYQRMDGTVFKSHSGNSMCGAPTMKSVTIVSNGLKIKWKKVPAADKYRVYRVEGGKYTKIGTSATNTFIDTKAGSGNKYTYTIRVVKDAKAVSPYASNPISAKFLAAPVLKSVEKNAARAFIAKWNKVSEGSGYQLQYSTKKNFSGSKTVTITAKKTKKKVVKKLTKGKTYYVRIRAYKGSGDSRIFSGYSVVKSVKLL